jgi:hypothetical protein
MPPLWDDPDLARWRDALGRYEAAIEERASARLPELDRWYRLELPPAIVGRTPPSVTLDELARVTEWKMKRGTYRARNLVLVRGNDAAEVGRASAEAIAAIPDPRRPIARLAELAGVGPATASAVLAVVAPRVYPFFDEDVAKQIVTLGKVAFTVPYYLRYAEALRARARALGDDWAADEVARASWAVRPRG